MVSEDEAVEQEVASDVDRGLLPGVDRGASGRGLLDRRARLTSSASYAELHELGEVTVIADPGLSGKNLEAARTQQLLHMVDEGHVANVLAWRLDRPVGNLGDLIMLADAFGQAGVALHSLHREDRPLVGDGPDVLQHLRIFRAVLPGAAGGEREHGQAAGGAAR